MDPQPAEEPPDSSHQVSGSSISNKFVAYTGGTDQKKKEYGAGACRAFVLFL